MLVDFNNSFTFGFADKLRNTLRWNLPPHLNSVAALPVQRYNNSFSWTYLHNLKH